MNVTTDRTEPQFDEIYREIILDHYRSPRNREWLADPEVSEEGLNPLCGDEIRVDLRFDDGRIAEIAAGGRGCSISQSSASMMTEAVKGRTVDEVESLIADFKHMMSTGESPEADLGDLESLAGVARLPVRVKCATLAWNVLKQGLEEHEEQENGTP